MGLRILRTIRPHAWDSVLSNLRNDGAGNLRNNKEAVILNRHRHSELDSESHSLCCVVYGIPGPTYYSTTRVGFRIK